MSSHGEADREAERPGGRGAESLRSKGHLWRGWLDGDGLGCAAGGGGLGLGLLLHGVVVGHAPKGHLGLTLKHNKVR